MNEMCWKQFICLLAELGSGSMKGLKVTKRVGYDGVIVVMVVLVLVGNLACKD